MGGSSGRRGSRHRVLRLLLAGGVMALSLSAGTGAATASPHGGHPTVALPPATGPHPIGTTTLHLVDGDRTDLWDPDPGVREMMVTLWYPARAETGRRAPYMSPEESAAAIGAQGLDIPLDALSSIGTNAFVDAPVAGAPRSAPLVVLSPGAGFGRAWLTVLAEGLAGNGFVVAGVDHAHEATGVAFPGGRLLDCLACGQDRWAEASLNRAADIGHVLDSLTGRGAPWSGSYVIDPRRIGVAGHSAGGSAVAEVLRSDPRVDAGIGFDAPVFPPALDEGTDRPLAMVTSDLSPPLFHDSQEQLWPRLGGWRQWLRLTDSGHSSVTDQGYLIDRLGLRDRLPAETMARQFGSLPTDQGLGVLRDYATAYFTHHLRGERQELVVDPPSVHPGLQVVEAADPEPTVADGRPQ
ncbi:alpha/beta hydrolase family protein [Marinactinospora thermotolerans]|uniref:alpha/beta hydrolase family protein n=1 Tax=Marinactinospora thermotolerans TaxID=531310 RepID=UPI003D8D6E17